MSLLQELLAHLANLGRTMPVPVTMDFDELQPGEESGLEQEPFVPRWRVVRAPLPRARLVRRS